MPKLTKFLGLRNELFGQEIPIQNNALTRIHITIHSNVLSIPEVINVEINGGLNRIPFESIFRIVVIALIGSLMCLSMKIQKKVVNKVTRRFNMCIPWRLE